MMKTLVSTDLLRALFFCFVLFACSCAGPEPNAKRVCSSVGDCLANERCVAGFCYSTNNNQNSNQNSNQNTNQNTGVCFFDNDCIEGMICRSGKCIFQESKAGEGELCSSGDSCAVGLVCVSPSTENNFRCRRRCAVSSDCASSEYCYGIEGGGASCQVDIGPPRDYKYKVIILSGKVTETHPTEGAWDAFGGLPDLYVVISIGGSSVKTSESTDSTSATWNESTSSSYTAEEVSNMTISLYDSDLTSDDLIASWKGFQIKNAKGNLWKLSNESQGVVFLEVQVTGSP